MDFHSLAARANDRLDELAIGIFIPSIDEFGERLRSIRPFVVDAGKIKRADFSVDGGPWTPLFPDDGIADSGHERYSVTLPVVRGEHTVSLRAFDSSGNVGTLSVTVRR